MPSAQQPDMPFRSGPASRYPAAVWRTMVSSDCKASDVASQGGGAGPGRDRHRRARSAVRAGWRGGRAPEPRAVIGARPGSPGPQGRGGRGSRARKCSSEDHLGISCADFGLLRSRAIAGKGCIGWGRVP
jgi:hypothetical protein